MPLMVLRHMFLDSAAAITLRGNNFVMGTPIQTLLSIDPVNVNTGIWLNNGYVPQDATKGSLAFTLDANAASPGWYFLYRAGGTAAGLPMVGRLTGGGDWFSRDVNASRDVIATRNITASYISSSGTVNAASLTTQNMTASGAISATGNVNGGTLYVVVSPTWGV